MSKELKTLEKYESLSRGLKALDEFRLLINNYEDKWDERTTSFFRDCHDIIEKELKVLEIIKDYALYIDWTWLFDCIIDNRSYEDYIEGCNATGETSFVDKKEFKLLKEVLQ